MELSKTINRRRSIRKYKNEDVSNEIVKKLIKNAGLAPSAKNRQPWNFMVVKGQTKNMIADIMISAKKKLKYSLDKHLYGINSSVTLSSNVIRNAPILILVFRPKDDKWLIGDTLSIGASIEHICLTATDLGLGSLWIRDIVYTDIEVASFVGKSDMELICAISIGYPDQNPKQRPRKKLTEILEWYSLEK